MRSWEACSEPVSASALSTRLDLDCDESSTAEVEAQLRSVGTTTEKARPRTSA